MKLVRLSTQSIYFWMIGVTVGFASIVPVLFGQQASPEVVQLAVLLMVTGLVIPVVHGLVDTINRLRATSAESNGGETR